MKTHNVVISAIAETDLRKIVGSIAVERIELANARQSLSRIHDAVLELETMP